MTEAAGLGETHSGTKRNFLGEKDAKHRNQVESTLYILKNPSSAWDGIIGFALVAPNLQDFGEKIIHKTKNFLSNHSTKLHEKICLPECHRCVDRTFKASCVAIQSKAFD
jgi:hypothetical protein